MLSMSVVKFIDDLILMENAKRLLQKPMYLIFIPMANVSEWFDLVIQLQKDGEGVLRFQFIETNDGEGNVGTHFETYNVGVLGPISLTGLNEGTRDLTRQKWSYKVGLKGESLSLHTLDGSSSVEWLQGSLVAQKQPLTWYKTSFNAPDGNEPLALDMNGMGKGQMWATERQLGDTGLVTKHVVTVVNVVYTGIYTENKCNRYCGDPSQRWYHVPRSWLRPTGNFLVVFEEWGGNPDWITLVKRS
ncbi:hypothetical protein L1887_35953 [Cichorium endivia]|nr:hypothetical protein L1887_35953 [Cichorium endivia]